MRSARADDHISSTLQGCPIVTDYRQNLVPHDNSSFERLLAFGGNGTGLTAKPVILTLVRFNGVSMAC